MRSHSSSKSRCRITTEGRTKYSCTPLRVNKSIFLSIGNRVHGRKRVGISVGCLLSTRIRAVVLCLRTVCPYCATGHKTTFGLGQTRAGWLTQETQTVPSQQSLSAQRIAELQEQFLSQRKRAGCTRATEIAETWATILARRELGESLMAIATDLEMRYETVKTYAKLARRALTQVS